MDYIKAKSEFNLDAAQKLIDDYDNPVSSVHCLYYGAFQLLRSKLNSLGHTYDKIDDEVTSSKSNPPVKHTHVYPLKLMCSELKTKINDNGDSARKLQDKMDLIKNFRIISDYKNHPISIEQAKQAISLGKEIKKILIQL